jgi:hypothetical protein
MLTSSQNSLTETLRTMSGHIIWSSWPSQDNTKISHYSHCGRHRIGFPLSFCFWYNCDVPQAAWVTPMVGCGGGWLVEHDDMVPSGAKESSRTHASCPLPAVVAAKPRSGTSFSWRWPWEWHLTKKWHSPIPTEDRQTGPISWIMSSQNLTLDKRHHISNQA